LVIRCHTHTRSYCWALVHSRDKRDASLGIQLVQAMLSQSYQDSAPSEEAAAAQGLNRRELLYLQAVGQYRRGDNLDARQTLKHLLGAYPDFRQAESLLEHVEDQVVKDGLVGLGAGAAILGVLGTVAIAVASGSKKR
jgi:fission 1 protein